MECRNNCAVLLKYTDWRKLGNENLVDECYFLTEESSGHGFAVGSVQADNESLFSISACRTRGGLGLSSGTCTLYVTQKRGKSCELHDRTCQLISVLESRECPLECPTFHMQGLVCTVAVFEDLLLALASLLYCGILSTLKFAISIHESDRTLAQALGGKSDFTGKVLRPQECDSERYEKDIYNISNMYHIHSHENSYSNVSISCMSYPAFAIFGCYCIVCSFKNVLDLIWPQLFHRLS